MVTGRAGRSIMNLGCDILHKIAMSTWVNLRKRDIMKESEFSHRELQVIKLLMEGKSNKQIALALKIAESTVEFHLKNIYAKLGVVSRVEAILKLQETTGILGDSTVDESGRMAMIEISHDELDAWRQGNSTVTSRISLAEIIRFLVTYKVPIFIWILLIIVIVWVFISQGKTAWTYEREGEYPDEYTVGKVINRPNASDEMVHGQFGTVPAWPAQPGYVKYSNIETAGTEHLFLRLRYSKYSSSSVTIQVYLDDESEPRFAILPVDQGDWDKFVWTDGIDLGSVKSGVHAIKFYTNGQTYGVADLDKFVLSTKSP
jgi:DNA-binding CsgD family transcriptional regulator